MGVHWCVVAGGVFGCWVSGGGGWGFTLKSDRITAMRFRSSQTSVTPPPTVFVWTNHPEAWTSPPSFSSIFFFPPLFRLPHESIPVPATPLIGSPLCAFFGVPLKPFPCLRKIPRVRRHSLQTAADNGDFLEDPVQEFSTRNLLDSVPQMVKVLFLSPIPIRWSCPCVRADPSFLTFEAPS